jgi:hypothetical protein
MHYRTSFLKVSLFLLAVFFGTGVSHAAQADDVDEQQSVYAQRWVEVIRRLDARNNIVMVISNRETLYELQYVAEVEAQSRFLVVRCMPPSGLTYRAVVYPGTILLVRETPKTPEPPKPKS